MLTANIADQPSRLNSPFVFPVLPVDAFIVEPIGIGGKPADSTRGEIGGNENGDSGIEVGAFHRPKSRRSWRWMRTISA